jgi:hypothetical protein
MKSESGDRIETTPAVFRQWRVTMAEKARDHGIAMEMTDRREFASPPAFTRNQVRPVNREGRTEHIGTSEAAQARYDAKRNGRRALAKSERSREYTVKATQSWQKVALASGDRSIVAYAAQQRDQLISGLSAGEAEATSNIVHADFGSKFRANLVTLQNLVLEGDELRETSRTNFEAYEKKVETALFKLERNVRPEERNDFDEVASVAREHVNGRRELMELYEIKSQAQAEQGTATERDESRERRDDANEQWNAAVAKHGEAVVAAADDILMDIETSREGLDRIEAGELSNDPSAFRADIERGLARAAELALQGNTYVREISENDPELKRAIEMAERTEGWPAEEKGKTAANVDAVTERQRDARLEEPERRPGDPAEREAHELPSTVDATNRLQDKLHKDKEAAQRSGETTRTDPAQQHIPRLEELEREDLERRERDRDDRER